MQSIGYAIGKDNIVPRETIVPGNIRCFTKEQIELTVNKMKAIVSCIH
jgi:metal-dependent amidase/aminoacylase/carboxypeptidase family protein